MYVYLKLASLDMYVKLYMFFVHCVCVYIYIYICVCVCVCVYIYILCVCASIISNLVFYAQSTIAVISGQIYLCGKKMYMIMCFVHCGYIYVKLYIYIYVLCALWIYIPLSGTLLCTSWYTNVLVCQSCIVYCGTIRVQWFH